MYRDGPENFSFQYAPESTSSNAKWGLILSLTIPNIAGNMVETLVESINLIFVGHLTLLQENERVVQKVANQHLYGFLSDWLDVLH